MGKLLAGLGIALTGLYAAFAWWLVGDRISQLQVMELNAVGDFFAGVFGPIAILWLVLGYFQQGIELRQGTAALNFQGEELKNSVEQQRQLASLSLQSLELERKDREEQNIKYRHSLRPILHLEGLRLDFENPIYRARCKLFNDGAQIYSVTVMLRKGQGRHYLGSYRTLERSASIQFDCMWHMDSAGDEIFILVYYKEHDSVEAMCRFVNDSDAKPGSISFVLDDELGVQKPLG